MLFLFDANGVPLGREICASGEGSRGASSRAVVEDPRPCRSTRAVRPITVHQEVRKSNELAFFLYPAEGRLPCGHSHVPARAPIWVASAARAQTIVQQSSASLRPGDSLRVRVWREPDLSGVFMVDEHGDLTFPRLGRRSVLNVPIDSIRARVQREYAEFVRDASVEITPLYRVRVNGAVLKPGLLPSTRR